MSAHLTAQIRELRAKEQAGTLAEEEAALLSALLEEADAAEVEVLRAETDSLRGEREAIEEQNRSLENLVHRKEAFVARLKTVVEEARAERQAIDAEVARLMGSGPVPNR
jgi:hypothetical protein